MPAYFFRTYECESGHRFEVMQERDEGAPECPFCDAQTLNDPMPASAKVGTYEAGAGDRAYRRLESTSKERADLVGDPGIKVTNLKDNLRAGEVAAMPVNNAVTQYAEGTNHNYFQQGAGGLSVGTGDLIAAARSGQERRTGAFALKAIQNGTVPGAPQVPPAGASSWGGGFAR